MGKSFCTQDRFRFFANAAEAPYNLASRRRSISRSTGRFWSSLLARKWMPRVKCSDVLVQSRRNKHAALKLMRKLLKGIWLCPRQAAQITCALMGLQPMISGFSNRHERGRWRNNRAENSHQPTRRKGEEDQGFKSARIRAKHSLLSASQQSTTPSTSTPIHTSARTHRAFRASAMQDMARSRRLRREPDVPGDLLLLFLQCDRALQAIRRSAAMSRSSQQAPGNPPGLGRNGAGMGAARAGVDDGIGSSAGGTRRVCISIGTKFRPL